MRPGLCKMNLYGVYNDMKYTLKYDRLPPDINVVKYHGCLISLTILAEVLCNVKNGSPFIMSKNSSKNLSYENKHSILPDFLENWHFLSHFVWKSTKTLKLLRIFDEIFDVINGDPFLTLYKTSAIQNYLC